MKKIVITGGIASGKSEFIRYLTTKNLKVLSADKINSELLLNKDYIAEIAKQFPDAVICGKVDKSRLKASIIDDKKNAELLNSIAHPIIKQRIEESLIGSDGIVFVEVPLLVESGMQDIFDCVVVIKTDEKQRLQRIMQRDCCDIQTAHGMIALQTTDEERGKYADYVINNNGDIKALYKEADELLKKLNISCKRLTK